LNVHTDWLLLFVQYVPSKHSKKVEQLLVFSLLEHPMKINEKIRIEI